jgi:hypothetical protein
MPAIITPNGTQLVNVIQYPVTGEVGAIGVYTAVDIDAEIAANGTNSPAEFRTLLVQLALSESGYDPGAMLTPYYELALDFQYCWIAHRYLEMSKVRASDDPEKCGFFTSKCEELEKRIWEALRILDLWGSTMQIKYFPTMQDFTSLNLIGCEDLKP